MSNHPRRRKPAHFDPMGYTDHAIKRLAMRWAGAPTKHPAALRFDPDRALVLSSAVAERLGVTVRKGRQVVASRDAVAVISGRSIVTLMRVGTDTIDDVRATMLCRAMGLGVEYDIPRRDGVVRL